MRRHNTLPTPSLAPPQVGQLLIRLIYPQDSPPRAPREVLPVSLLAGPRVDRAVSPHDILLDSQPPVPLASPQASLREGPLVNLRDSRRVSRLVNLRDSRAVNRRDSPPASPRDSPLDSRQGVLLDSRLVSLRDSRHDNQHPSPRIAPLDNRPRSPLLSPS